MKFFQNNINCYLCYLFVFFNVFLGGGMVVAFNTINDLKILSLTQKTFIIIYVVLCLILLLMTTFYYQKIHRATIKKITSEIFEYQFLDKSSKFIFNLLPFITVGFFAKNKLCKIVGILKILNVSATALTLYFLKNIIKILLAEDLKLYDFSALDLIIIIFICAILINCFLSFMVIFKYNNEKHFKTTAVLFIAGIISVAICIYTPIHLANAEQTKTEISLDKLRKIYNSPLTPQSLEDKYIRRNGKRIAVNFQKFQSIMPINEDNPSDKGETLIKNMPIPFLLKMSHEEQQKLNKWFNDYQSYFEDLDRIIAENNHLRLSSTWRNFNELLYGMSLIEYGFIRSWARTYRSRSIYYVNKGKIAEAINLIPLQQRVISYSASDFSLISYLVRIAYLDIFRLQIENLVASKKLPAKKVKELIIYLRKTKEQNIEDLETAFCGETTIAIDCLDRLRDEYMIDWTTNPKEFNNSYYQSTNNFFRSSIFYNYLLAPRKYAVEKEYKLCYDFFIARSDLTNPNTEKILDNMTRDAPISYTFFDLIAMDFDGAYIKKIEIDNSLEALIGILYIELFRQKFNRLPKDFAEMEKFSADFPKFNEKWRYINGELTVLNNGIKSKRHGFRIYNIGRNNEDNNGLHGREKVKNSPTIYHDDANSTVFTD